MAKIKHIALATQDPDKTAAFFKEVFGLQEVGKVNGANAEGYYLSDGNINLAILNFKNPVVAGGGVGGGGVGW
ncbi:MAG TPA: glyoxalase, partial [Dehalococcoidia bacterium]|nr:glyoxalase [Dehalococcoidia bacterium]